MKRVWCAARLECDSHNRVKPGRIVWCATFRNAEFDKAAVRDKTACGAVVTLRVGSAVRTPTCPQCKARVKRRR